MYIYYRHYIQTIYVLCILLSHLSLVSPTPIISWCLFGSFLLRSFIPPTAPLAARDQPTWPTHRPTDQPTNRPTDQPTTDQSTNDQSTNRPIDQSTNRPTNQSRSTDRQMHHSVHNYSQHYSSKRPSCYAALLLWIRLNQASCVESTDESRSLLQQLREQTAGSWPPFSVSNQRSALHLRKRNWGKKSHYATYFNVVFLPKSPSAFFSIS